MQQQTTVVQPTARPQMQPRIRTAGDVFRRKEEEKGKERQRLFESFESGKKTEKTEQEQKPNQKENTKIGKTEQKPEQKKSQKQEEQNKK